jgi:hypothetical protein
VSRADEEEKMAKRMLGPAKWYIDHLPKDKSIRTQSPEYHPPTNRKEALHEIISITIFLCASLAGAYYGILGWFLKLFSVILFFYLFKAIINYQDLPEHPHLSRRQAINWSVITDGLKAILLLSILVIITYRVEIAVGSWQANLSHHPYYGQPSFYLLFVLLIVYVLVLVIVDSFWE